MWIYLIVFSPMINYLDPFQPQKEHALVTSYAAILALAHYLTENIEKVKGEKTDKVKVIFNQLFKVSKL